MTPKKQYRTAATMDACVNSVSNLLANILKAKNGAGVGSEASVLSAISDAKECLNTLATNFADVEELLKPEPLKVPTKQELLDFDKSYFAYLEDKKKELTEHKVFYALATWLYDHDGRGLEKIEDAFGKGTAEKTKQYYDDDNHDT